ncbi:uncharacterized protein V6R79_009973 [Siganus canaliculatus]
MEERGASGCVWVAAVVLSSLHHAFFHLSNLLMTAPPASSFLLHIKSARRHRFSHRCICRATKPSASRTRTDTEDVDFFCQGFSQCCDRGDAGRCVSRIKTKRNKQWCVNPAATWLKDKISTGKLACPPDLSLLISAQKNNTA